MAHVMKFTKAACGHMFKHYERAKDENGEYIKFGNENIDTSRTQNNYNLAPVHQNGQGEFIRQRCGEVKMQNRKDVNVMCSWVVTAPKDLPQEDERQFFEATYKFLSDRYGKDNTVSAHVHMDEVTPHMHYAFVPVVENKKKGGYKVSAKEAVNLRDLQTFHNDLSEYLQQVFGREINVLNEATKEGNKTIEELKRGTLLQEAQEARETIDRATELRSLIPNLIEQRNAQETQIKALQRELEKLEGKVLNAEEVNAVDGKKRLLSNKLKNVTYSEYLSLKKTASKVESMKKERDEALKKVKTVADREKALETRKKEIEKTLNERQKEIEQERPTFKVQMENVQLEAKVRKLEEGAERLINALPEDQRKSAKDIFEGRGGQSNNKNRGWEK